MSVRFHPACRKCLTCALHGSQACRLHETWYDNTRAGFFQARPAGGSRPEISKRVSFRIDKTEVELQRLVDLFTRKGDMMKHGQVKACLLAALGNVKRARMFHVVPLVPMNGEL